MKYLLSQIAAIAGGRFTGTDRTVRSIVTDSRSLTCELGTEPLFVAMHGANHDSHDFIAPMQARGVRAFLVERPVAAAPECGYVEVPNAVEALQRLAAHLRAQFRGTVVAVTGSNGKTVVKEWIAEELPAGMKYFRSPKSYNSQLGVPLSVLMLDGDERLAIFEAGISQPGEMARLERILRPDVALFTSIGDAHQEHFRDLEQKCAEKMTLAEHAPTIVYHSAYAPLGRMIAELLRRPAAGRRGGDAPVSAQVAGNEASHRNAQLVEAFCAAMGYPQPAFAAAPAVAMRLEVKDGINDSVLINDAYNLDLNSLALALDYLHGVALARRRTLVLSDIVQSGLREEELYGRVAEMVARAGIDTLVGIGPAIRRHAALFACDKEFYATTGECIDRIDRRAVAGRAVLLKGARDYRFERLAHALARQSHTTVLEIDLDAMTGNLNRFRSKLRPGTKLVAMVKTGSYGAGDFEVAQLLQHQGVDYLAVAFADEGVLLRERGIAMPIVVLNADAGSFDLMIANRLEPEIYSFRSLESFAAAAAHAGESRYPIHVKLDTGMHRLGFEEDRLGELAALLPTLRQVKVATIFSPPQLRRHARGGCLHAGADRPLRPHVVGAGRRAPLPRDPPHGQLGGDRTLPRGAVRHVPPRTGPLRLRLAPRRGAAPGLHAPHAHRAAQAPARGRRRGLRPRRKTRARHGHGDHPRGLCRRSRPPPRLRPLVGARRRTPGADRGAHLHGQLHDRRHGDPRRAGGRRGYDLLPDARQRPRGDGRGARHDPLRGPDVGVGARETDLPQGVRR